VQIRNQSSVSLFNCGQWSWQAGARLFVLCSLVIVSGSAWLAAQDAASQGGSIHGVVKSGNIPLPGATISAANTLTGQKVTTSTDVDGSYSLQIPSDGHYVVRAQMAAFAPVTQEVRINVTNHDAEANLELILLSRVPKSEPADQTAPAQAGATGTGRGFQSLTLEPSAEGRELNGIGGSDIVPQGMPVPGIEPDSATESVAVSGNTSSPFAGMSSTEMQQRFNDARQQGGGGFGGGGPGGPGGFGGGGFGGGGFGGGGFGGGGPIAFGRRGFDINRPHGSIYYGIGDSALNAASYSLTGQPVIKPGYEQNSFGGSIGGPLNIPKIYHGGDKTFFFVNYNGKRGDNPFDQFSTVPTLLERLGNFSQTVYTSSPDAGQPVQIFNPSTHTLFPNNTIAQINPAAAGLLKYIPLPNLPGSFQNFHFVTSAESGSDDLNVRINHSFSGALRGRRQGGRRGQQNNLTFGFHYHGSTADLTNPFPSVGGHTDVRSFDVPISYTRSFGKLTNIAHFDFNRSRTRTRNLYAFVNDVTGNLGIDGVSQNPFDWGLPSLSFTNFGGLQDTNPQLQRNQTFSYSDNMIWNHGKHTFRWGGDFHRVQLNTETDSNARGSFIFTGLNTSQLLGGQPVAGTGFDFADFLLGMPQQTAAQFGTNNYHFRGNFWDLFAQDEWKVRGNLTLNLGVRYEYVSPFTEIDNRIVNLDLSPGVLSLAGGTPAVAVVLPGQVGPYSGRFPDTLVRPDRNNFAPRIGFAWKPFSKTVVRGGYGINYNTGAYQGMVQQLAFQPPFSFAETNVQSSPGELTLQSGFPPVQAARITNNYAANLNYRLGYVQIRNLDVQQQIRPTLLLNIDYTGTKGTDLDILEAPNRTATGLRILDVQAFNFQNAVGDSEANAGSVRLRKRLSQGFSLGGTYTFSKSIDDASSIGGSSGASNVAQNAFDLSAERGLSSFNQTHKFTADYLWELPLGHDKRWLTGNSLPRDLFGDWQWSGDFTIASGLPFTPRLLGDFSDVERGTNGTLRPDLVAGESIAISNPSIGQWFNISAFVAPPVGQYGDARRNSIIGPPTRVFDMAFTKIFPLKESRVLEFRASASNVFNIPQYSSIDSVVNSPTFGRVTAVGVMRAIQLTARFRF
jgi:trimeric autotransporter adhesin